MSIEAPTTDYVDEAPPTEPPVRPSSSPPPWRPIGAILVVIAVAIGSFALGRSDAGSVTGVTTTPTTAATAPPINPGDEPVAAVAASLTPSMVQIQTQAGIGSGFIYDSSGLIMTAAHVVNGSNTVVVQLADGTRVDGTVVGTDPVGDIGVVQISAPNLVPAPLAIDQPLLPGQMAVALGSPFGLDETVTSGVVSSIGRAVTGPDGSVRELIQTDAPINPGNSGGALADRQGQVIGVNDQIFSTSGGNQGVGFAIPITRAKTIADSLVAGVPIKTAFLGVSGTDPTLGTAGALITGVEPGSPAGAAGIQSGDLITSVDGTPVESFTDLAGLIRSHEPGDQVQLGIQRNGNPTSVTATLGSH